MSSPRGSFRCGAEAYQAARKAGISMTIMRAHVALHPPGDRPPLARGVRGDESLSRRLEAASHAAGFQEQLPASRKGRLLEMEARAVAHGRAVQARRWLPLRDGAAGRTLPAHQQ